MIRPSATLLVLIALAISGCGLFRGAQSRSAVAPVVLPPARPEARVAFEEGVRLLPQGPKKYDGARDAFKRAVAIDAKMYEAWHNLGFVEARQGRWEPARAAFRRGLDIQPASRKTLVALGEVLARLGRWDETRALYVTRLKADPGDLDLRFRYIQTLREGGRASDALEEVKVILARDSKSATAFNALGLTYLKMDKHALAESAFRRAAELDAKAAAFWNNLGLVALAKGRNQEAFQAFQKAVDLDGGYREAHLNKAVVFLDCGDYKRATVELEKARKMDPGDPETYVALGVAARGQKRFDEARAFYEQALSVNPDFPPAYYDLAILYMDFQPDKKKARENLLLFRKLAASDDPKLADALARLKELK